MRADSPGCEFGLVDARVCGFQQRKRFSFFFLSFFFSHGLQFDKGIASMKFYCKSNPEMNAVITKVEEIRKEQMAIRELKSNDLKRGISIPRSMLASSERFKRKNQRGGGMEGMGNTDDKDEEL